METTKNRIHPFEQAGLGTAPFRYVRSFHSAYQAIPGDPSCPVQPGSSCDYCGTGIYDVYVIRSANGREFKVGCDCVAKVSREAATTDDEKLAAKVDDARRRLARQKAHKLAARKADELKALLADEAVRAKLASQPHPNKFRAEKGDTLLSWAEWMAKRAGATGRAKALKAIKAAS